MYFTAFHKAKTEVAAVKKQSEGLKREYDHLMKEFEQLQVGGSGSPYKHCVLKLCQQNCLLVFIVQENLPESLG